MKRIIFSALSVLFCALAFVGCTKDATLEKNIVGEWEAVNYCERDSKEWYPLEEIRVYEFKSKTGYSFYVDDEDGDPKDEDKRKFDYTIEDQLLTIKYKDGGKSVFTIQSLTAKRMVWKASYSEKIELRKR